MSEIMTAKDLCLWYGDNKALKDINIAIPEKSITALRKKLSAMNTGHARRTMAPQPSSSDQRRRSSSDVFITG